MAIRAQDLQAAAEAGVLSHAQADALGRFLAARHADTPRFSAAHVLYYLGGLIAIGAMTLFMTLGWEAFGGAGLFGLAACYAALAIILLRYFLYQKRLRIPAGIMGAFAVALVPLAVYGLQVEFGVWPGGFDYRDLHRYIEWRWLFMELATLAVGAVLLWRYRLAFMVLPVAVTLWYLSMDLAPLLLPEPGYGWDGWWEFRQFVSLWFGLLVVLFALWVDLRNRSGEDYAFWLYLFGVAAFWGGLSLQSSDSEWAKLGYCGINLAMIALGTLLGRRVFAVFGGFGLALYLGHLAYETFEDSLLFPFALSALGLAVIVAGVYWQRHEAGLARALRRPLPEPVQALLARRG